MDKDEKKVIETENSEQTEDKYVFSNDYDEDIKLTFSDILAMMIALMQLIIPYILAFVVVYFLFILFVTKVWLV